MIRRDPDYVECACAGGCGAIVAVPAAEAHADPVMCDVCEGRDLDRRDAEAEGAAQRRELEAERDEDDRPHDGRGWPAPPSDVPGGDA